MRQTPTTESIYAYMVEIGVRETSVQTELRKKTSDMPMSRAQSSPIEAQFLQMMVRISKAKSILELGTYAGYSALSMALALPETGKLITCDINEAWTSVAKDFWRRAGVEHKISLKLGPALTSLEELIQEGSEQSFDLIVIDADKANYVDYYEYALRLIRPTGVILVDNVLWKGDVTNLDDTSRRTSAIRRLNALLKNDPRVHVSMINIGDGLFIITPQ